MSANQLSAVLFHGLSDERFCRSLLDSPDVALTRFDLSTDEMDALASISTRASTIEEFAVGMASWLSGDQATQRSTVPVATFATS
jgi:hypothetical protein